MSVAICWLNVANACFKSPLQRRGTCATKLKPNIPNNSTIVLRFIVSITKDKSHGGIFLLLNIKSVSFSERIPWKQMSGSLPWRHFLCAKLNLWRVIRWSVKRKRVKTHDLFCMCPMNAGLISASECQCRCFSPGRASLSPDKEQHASRSRGMLSLFVLAVGTQHLRHSRWATANLCRRLVDTGAQTQICLKKKNQQGFNPDTMKTTKLKAVQVSSEDRASVVWWWTVCTHECSYCTRVVH